jgi:ribosomal protein S18 acetylase RimI-like enzyme
VTGAAYFHMRRSLTGSLEAAVWPDGTRLKPFSEGCARDCHALLELAYRDGGGSVPAFGAWWTSLSQDGEFDPALCFPVYDGETRLAGFAQCWTSGFVKDLGVHPGHRRRGIGRALLTHIFQVFRLRGIEAVSLKVEASNPSGAVQFYQNLGMRRIAD